MRYDADSKTFTREIRFESDPNTEDGDEIRQEDFDRAVDEVVDGLNIAASLIPTELPVSGDAQAVSTLRNPTIDADGSDTYALDQDLPLALVFIDGVQQNFDAFTHDQAGRAITFAENVPSGSEIEVLFSAGTAAYSLLTFEDAASFFANETITYSNTAVGSSVVSRKEGFSWKVLISGATGSDITKNGVDFAALTDSGGRIYFSQIGGGTSDDTLLLPKLINCLTSGRTKHIVFDVDVTLPGVNSAFGLTNAEVPDGCTVEFINGAQVKYDSDGSVPHSYVRFDGVSNLTLIKPDILNDPPATTRTAQDALGFNGSEDVKVYQPVVDGTSGAGVLGKRSKRIRVYDGLVKNVLADGYHWRNGDEASPGNSEDCWTYGCVSENTGDDGFANVSYREDLPANQPVKRCGHLDFTSKTAGARGSSVIGGEDVRMRGVVENSNSSGILVAQEAAFTSWPSRKVDLDVITHGCGTASNGAVRIGRGADRITGRVVSYGAAFIGLHVGDIQSLSAGGSNPSLDVNLIATVVNAGGAGVIANGFRRLFLPGLKVWNVGASGSEFVNGDGLVSGDHQIEKYSQAAGGKWGLRISGVDNFMIGEGIVRDDDTGAFQSLKPVQVLNSEAGHLAKQIISGGSAGDTQLEIQDNCINVTTDQGRIITKGGASVDLKSNMFGGDTLVQFTSGSAQTVNVPLNATEALPLNTPINLFNRTGPDVTVSGSGTFVGASLVIAQNETLTLRQIGADIWHAQK